ncbi:MAG: hypothetical protein NTV51_29285 [Verrucomicrobia bacterium]|nr:hypothetical protein [Verrucomicrobiota bacterium]
MELSTDTIEHLRDEAYATLCRRAVEQSLVDLEREKAEISSTRPPFGFLASRQARETFERSMHAATGTEEALRARLGQIKQLEKRLQGIIHAELRGYLGAISPDYRCFTAVEHLLDQWEAEYAALPELLVAFARDARSVQAAASSAAGTRDLQPFAVLREAALRIEQQFDLLDRLVAQFTALLPDSAVMEVNVPTLPDFRRVAWVNRAAALPSSQLLAETTRVVRSAREFVAAGQGEVPVLLAAAHKACKRHEEIFLQRYWNQLRAHAQAHYVEKRGIDEVIEMLMHTSVTSDLARRQRELTAADPFLGVR